MEDGGKGFRSPAAPTDPCWENSPLALCECAPGGYTRGGGVWSEEDLGDDMAERDDGAATTTAEEQPRLRAKPVARGDRARREGKERTEAPEGSARGPRRTAYAPTRRLLGALRSDWLDAKYYPYAALTLCVSVLVTAIYYLNHPRPDIFPDTATYRYVAVVNITQHGTLVDPHRVPGYPMLMAVVYAIAGANNDGAVSLVQAGLFVLAVLEIYAAAYLLLRRAGMACVIALVVGANVELLSFIKPVLSEGLALWCIASLALALLWCLHRLQARYVWVVAGFLVFIFLTRAEWSYAPLLIFGYMLFVAARHGRARALLPHVVAACLLCYLIVGAYVYVNATQNNYGGIVDTQNIDLFGKVVQYHLQDTAPTQYAQITRELDSYLANGGTSSDLFLSAHPELEANHYALAGAYASAIVKRNVVKFAVDSAETSVTSLASAYSGSQISATGPLAKPLSVLQTVSILVYRGTLLFVPCLLLWTALFFWKRTSRSLSTELMGGVILLALYDLVLTSVGGFDAYARYHAPFVPLLLLTILGSLCIGLRDGVPALRRQPAFVAFVESVKRTSHAAAGELFVEEPKNDTQGEVVRRWEEWMTGMRNPPVNGQ